MDGLNLPDRKRWVILYPVYINSKKTLAEGRRIGTAKSCEDPTCAEIRDCCNYLKIPSFVEEDKAYPRDFMQRGRVRISLKREDGSLINPSVDSRKQLMVRVAELIPKHHGRSKKQETSSAGTSKASSAGTSKASSAGTSKVSNAGTSKASNAGSSKASNAGPSKSNKGRRKK
ncbi:Signal recognition particle 19 kDa protein [Zostera marina]|uniref:Signal recognition particle 19 kDa protein n=1 Tax=Zostera marina TaxID=29655 RepID=A0A0K9PGM2_ZOSMR|nr:Signal recognition particle 19 kDa protein [Zostera marina]